MAWLLLRQTWVPLCLLLRIPGSRATSWRIVSIYLLEGIELSGTVSNKSTEENLVTTITIRKSGYLPRCTPSLFTLLQVDGSFSCPAGL
jgi:hypothetical protein